MNREAIINNMCLTYRHDFGLRISEDDKIYSLSSGMTETEANALWRNMAQIFDNDIAPLLQTASRYEDGTHVPLPKNKEQANAMIIVAEHYLKHNK